MDRTAIFDGIAITGVAETDYVRGTDRSTRSFIMESALGACVDAGVDPSTIDGLVMPFPAVTNEDFITHLGITDLRFHTTLDIGGAAPAACVAIAAYAVASGLANRVLVTTGYTGYSGNRFGSGSADLVDKKPVGITPGVKSNLEYPYGIVVPMQWYSMHANRYFHETGADPVGMENFALSTRAHANRNPKAHFRDRTLSSAQYRESPYLVKPFHLFDISLESDGAASVIVERASRSNSTKKPVFIAGGGEGHPDQPDTLTSRHDILNMGITKVAKRVFADLDMRADEADFAEIYDCFTFIALRQMEELGLCGRGEAPDFATLDRIGPGGSFPVNTHGGLLSQAHINGMNHIAEAVKQLRGEMGESQIADAKVGLVTGYGEFSNGSLLVLHN
jgi:acetyl-CoA acetyltransferase